MKKLTLIAFFLGFTGFSSFSQELEGTVLNKETKEPIAGVHVTLPKFNYSTITNKKGEFVVDDKIKLADEDSLYFSYVGYSTNKITVSELQELNFTLYLEESSEELNEITLESNRKLQSKINFKRLASLETKLYSFGSVLIGDKIYVAGGDQSYREDGMRREMESNPMATFEDLIDASSTTFAWEKYNGSLQIYDISSDTWETSDLKLEKRANNNLISHGEKIIISGGTTVSRNGKFEYLADIIEVVDLKNDTVLVDEANPHQASGAAAFIYKDNMIVMGGSSKTNRNGTKDFFDKVHLYNFKTGLWYEIGNMPVPKETQGVLIDDKIFLVGGSQDNPLNGIESFNLTTGRWEKEAEMFQAYDQLAVTNHNKIIYFYDDGTLGSFNTVTGELNEYSIDLGIRGARLHYSDNKLYILGGYEETRFMKKPAAGCYSIDLAEFSLTEIQKSSVY